MFSDNEEQSGRLGTLIESIKLMQEDAKALKIGTSSEEMETRFYTIETE